MSLFATKFRDIVDFIFPPVCPICGTHVANHGEICGNCWGKFTWIGNPKCIRCGYPFPADLDLGPHPFCPTCAAGGCTLDLIRSACVYDEASRGIMLPFKHCGRVKFGTTMSRAMLTALNDTDISPDIIMPVPLAYRRLVHRAYNQSTILARPIAKHYNAPIDLTTVARAYRPDMGHKNAKQRAKNVHGVFSVIHPERVRGKRILLVDDVMTTGATFAELCRVLKRAGASSVYGVTFCRVIRAI